MKENRVSLDNWFGDIMNQLNDIQLQAQAIAMELKEEFEERNKDYAPKHAKKEEN